MLTEGIPLTREKYLALRFEDPAAELDGETLASVPLPFRKQGPRKP